MKKKLLGPNASSYAMLAAVGAITIPAVVWLICKASHMEIISKVLREMK